MECPLLQSFYGINHFYKQLIMATTVIRDYELMLIFTPVLTDDEFKTAQKELIRFIEENEGEIVHVNPWGLRSLAYPIQKKTTGFYVVLEYKAPTDLNKSLEVRLNRDESVMRHMVTALDKYAVEYNAKRRGASTETESKES